MQKPWRFLKKIVLLSRAQAFHWVDFELKFEHSLSGTVSLNLITVLEDVSSPQNCDQDSLYRIVPLCQQNHEQLDPGII